MQNSSRCSYSFFTLICRFQVAADNDTNIFLLLCLFQVIPVHGVIVVQIVPAQVQHMAFDNIEAHFPLICPVAEFIKCLLQTMPVRLFSYYLSNLCRPQILAPKPPCLQCRHQCRWWRLQTVLVQEYSLVGHLMLQVSIQRVCQWSQLAASCPLAIPTQAQFMRHQT